jgi:alpha-tubulin suppressor-like RCC1 family protein
MFKQRSAVLTTIVVVIALLGVRHARADMAGGVLVTPSGASTQAQARMRYVAAGDMHTCVVLHNGSVKCFGLGADGQLGNDTGLDSGYSTSSSVATTAAIELGLRRTARAIAVGSAHSCALLDNFTVKCWGFGAYGRLGYGDTVSRGDGAGEMAALVAIDFGTGRTATAIAVGSEHSCALLDNSAVKCWGRNQYGQLGYGDTDSRGDGAGEMGNALLAINFGAGRTARAIAAGKYFTCALLDNFAVTCWGANTGGQLGLGDTTDRTSPTALTAIDFGSGLTARALSAGDDHVCAILDDGALKCWGAAGNGRLGSGGTSNIGDGTNEMGAKLAAVSLGSSGAAMAVSAGQAHTCVVFTSTEVKCFGNGGSGRLGVGNQSDLGDSPSEMGLALPVINLGDGRTALAVSAGAEHTCALLDNASLKCWGSGDDGRRGSSNRVSVGGISGDMAALVAVNLGTDTTVNIATEPTAPRSVVGIAGDTQASVSWGAPTSDGGSEVTDYIVEYQQDGAATWSVFADGTSNTTSATVAGLTNVRAYQFRVSALNAVNTSATSGASVAVTPDTTTTTTSTTTTTTTTTTVPSGGSSGAAPSAATTTTTLPTSATLQATTTTVHSSTTVALPLARRALSALVVPAFSSYAVALALPQQQALVRYSKQLRAGDTVRCVAYSEPNPFGVVTRISAKRAQAVCAFLALRVPGVRTAWSAQMGPTSGISAASATLMGQAKATNLARRVVVTETLGS